MKLIASRQESRGVCIFMFTHVCGRAFVRSGLLKQPGFYLEKLFLVLLLEVRGCSKALRARFVAGGGVLPRGAFGLTGGTSVLF